MQQLIITLVALLGMIVPVANSRTITFFNRMVPQMPVAGRLPTMPRWSGESVTVVPDVPLGVVQTLLTAVQQALQQVLQQALQQVLHQTLHQPARRRPDPQQRRVRRAQRATGWRRVLNDRTGPLLHTRAFFCSFG